MSEKARARMAAREAVVADVEGAPMRLRAYIEAHAQTQFAGNHIHAYGRMVDGPDGERQAADIVLYASDIVAVLDALQAQAETLALLREMLDGDPVHGLDARTIFETLDRQLAERGDDE